MSRQIDLSKPLSEEDRKYLATRDDKYSLELNAAAVAGSGFDDDDLIAGQGDGSEGDGQEKPVEDMNVGELQDKLRALGLPVSGNKDELVARILDAVSQ